jgi:curved DNA-binding protein CbpA
MALDIDANGILNVTATDMGTGKAQTVTIKESTTLDQSEVERMIWDAEQHAAEDKGRRETIDARHQADSLAYQLERTLKEAGDKVPLHEKSRSEQLIQEARQAVQDESVTRERYQQLVGDLQQALHMIASVAYQQAGPAGILPGQKIRLAGQGGPGLGEGPRGDLYLKIEVEPHPRFRLDGRDIYLNVALTPWEAALGAEVEVRTPAGPVALKIPKGTQSGRKMRLKGKGMPGPKGPPGDLYAVAQIKVPKGMSEQERKAFEVPSLALLLDASGLDSVP